MDFNSFHPSEQQKEIIISGFLIKSPPFVEENKPASSLWALGCGGIGPPLIKKRWRQRFCVLYKVRSRDATGIFFEYYKDKQCLKLKGHVDLKNCECIADDYQVGKWLNVFSIHTKYKGDSRIYYFSAPDPQSMSDWVRHLVEIKGFVDNSQLPAEPAYPPFPCALPGTQNTWDSHQRRVGLNQPLPSPLPFADTNRSRNPSLTINNHASIAPRGTVDDYRELPPPGGEYLFSAPEGEKDPYYPLPPENHSYVNLTGDGDQRVDVVYGDGYNYLPPLQSSDDPHTTDTYDPLPSVPPRPSRQTSNNDDPTVNPLKPQEPVPKRERTESSDSVYFNVWEASVVQTDGTDRDAALEPPSAIPKTSPVSISAKSKNLITARPVRMFRRNERLSQYHQTPLAPPSTTASNYTNDSAPVPLRTRSPVPPPSVKIPTAATLPPNFSCLEPAVKPTIVRVPSTESDLALPVRAPDATEENEESDSTSTGSTLSEENQSEEQFPLDTSLNGAPPETAPSPPETTDQSAASRSGTQNEPSARNVAQPADSTPSQQSTRRMQQLNYIEPCNLEIGSQSTNGNIPRPLPPKRLQNTKLSGAQIDNAPQNPVSVSMDLPTVPPDDYKIEYKEIDPIETNALAIASKCYLDDYPSL